MNDLNFEYKQIIDGQGFQIAFAGMAIVFLALVLVSIFIALLPRLLNVVNRILPPSVPAHSSIGHQESPQSLTSPSVEESTATDEIAAVVGYVFHIRHQK